MHPDTGSVVTGGGRRARALLALCSAGALALGAAACSDDGDRLTIYSGRTEDLIGPLLEQYADETGTGIDVRYGDSADLALLIDQEGDRSPADVFLSQSPGALGYLAGDGRLQPLPDDVLSLVPERFESSAGDWVGLSGRVRVLVYNTELVDPADLPTSVLDLTDPQYAGELGVAPTNGSFQDFVTAMREHVGDDETAAWLDGLADGGARAYPNNVSIVEAVGRGEIRYGLVNHYYNERAKQEDPAVTSENHFFPDGDLGGLILVTGIGVLDTADDADQAGEFVRFLLSEQAQTYFAAETFEYPLVDGIAPAGDQPPLESIPAPEENLSRLGAELATTRELIDSSGLAAG
jgi:iron(III) transport system substrate-binding protein